MIKNKLIIYQDTFLLIANKPAGLLSVPGRGEDKQDCLISRLQCIVPDALTVHRLDQATSGLMIFARGAAMQRALSILFQTQQVAKQYLAVAKGIPQCIAGEINLPLITDWPNRPKQKVDFDIGKPSLTKYHLLSSDEKAQTSRIALTPITGRSHQLRLHLAAIGHPILGDALYGDRYSAPRLLLHASNLAFIHPVTQQNLSFQNDAPF